MHKNPRTMTGNRSLLRSIKKQISEHLLVIATFISVVLGVIVGSIVRLLMTRKPTKRELMYVNFVGELFLRILRSLILPLIVTSLITGIASLNLNLSRKIGARAVSFYLTTTFLSVVLGITLVTIIQPGVGGEVSDIDAEIVKKTTTVDTLLDLLRNICPPNLIQACLEQSTTDLTPPKSDPNSTGWFIQSIVW